MSEKLYRRYIQGVISKANRYKVQFSRNMVYNELTKWLKSKDIRLESEMFKAVLTVSKKMFDEYQEYGTTSAKETSEFMGMFFHTFTGQDGIHTDAKIIENYITEFWPVLQNRYEQEKNWGCVDLRMRKVDVARLGNLFDEVLARVEETETKKQIEELFNDFVFNNLEE